MTNPKYLSWAGTTGPVDDIKDKVKICKKRTFYQRGPRPMEMTPSEPVVRVKMIFSIITF